MFDERGPRSLPVGESDESDLEPQDSSHESFIVPDDEVDQGQESKLLEKSAKTELNSWAEKHRLKITEIWRSLTPDKQKAQSDVLSTAESRLAGVVADTEGKIDEIKGIKDSKLVEYMKRTKELATNLFNISSTGKTLTEVSRLHSGEEKSLDSLIAHSSLLQGQIDSLTRLKEKAIAIRKKLEDQVESDLMQDENLSDSEQAELIDFLGRSA